MTIPGLPERILVTGGAGLIGSHITDRLLAAGHEVVIYDNFSTGREANIAHLKGHDRVRVIRGDILDARAVDAAVGGCGYVFHMAAAVGVASVHADPMRVILTNVHGAENVMSACERRGSGVLVASTSEVYGKSPNVPYAEDDDRLLGPTRVNRWAYSISKALDEHVAFDMARRGHRATVVRYFNTYGPRMQEHGDGQVIARFALQAVRGAPITVHGDGEQTRCFTFVADTARATIMAAASEKAVGDVFNIGSDEEISINALATLVRDSLGSRSVIEHVSYESEYGANFEDTRRRVPDLTKTRRVLGFEAEVDLRAGLARTLPWCREAYTSSASTSA